jgi:hypothetical protein
MSATGDASNWLFRIRRSPRLSPRLTMLTVLTQTPLQLQLEWVAVRTIP